MARPHPDMMRFRRIDEIILDAVTATCSGTSDDCSIDSASIVGAAVRAIALDGDFADLAHLLVIDALYHRLEQLLSERGWEPSDGVERPQ